MSEVTTTVNHGSQSCGVSFSRAHCADCGRAVTLNKFGRCPTTILQISTTAAHERALQGNPAAASRPTAPQIPYTVLGAKYTPGLCPEHGIVNLNKVGACPKCYVAAGLLLSEQTRAAKRAAQEAAATPAPSTPDLQGEGLEAIAKDPEEPGPQTACPVVPSLDDPSLLDYEAQERERTLQPDYAPEIPVTQVTEAPTPETPGAFIDEPATGTPPRRRKSAR